MKPMKETSRSSLDTLSGDLAEAVSLADELVTTLPQENVPESGAEIDEEALDQELDTLFRELDREKRVSLQRAPTAVVAAPPRLLVLLPDSRAEAFLHIEVPEGTSLKPEDLRALAENELRNQGVVAGLIEEELSLLIHEALENGIAERCVARQVEPEPGKDGKIQWKIPRKTDKEPILVAVGKILAELEPAEPGRPGTTVTGDTLPAPPGRNPTLIAGKGVRFDPRRRSWIAVAAGRVLVSDNVLMVVPHQDGTFHLEISSDGMAAYLSVTPAQGTGQPVSLESVAAELRSRGVSVFDEEAVRTAIDLAAGGQMITRRIIAAGKPAEPGRDGTVEMLVALPETRRGSLGLVFVHEGERLARLHPPVPGKGGRDVRGREIPPPPVRDAVVSCGDGVEIRDGVLVATKGGHLLRRGDLFEIRDILEYPRDLKATEEPIDFDGHVAVQGSVGDNVRLRARGTIAINGSVGAAEIIAEGDIEIAGGIAGRDRARIVAGGSLHALYAERADIRAGKRILLERAALNASLSAGEGIEIRSEKGAIIGGRTVAGRSVTARTVGTTMGTPTVIRAGIRAEVKEQVREIDGRLIKIRNVLRKIQTGLNELVRDLKVDPDEVKRMAFRELTRRKIGLLHEIKVSLEKRALLLKKIFPAEEPVIEILDKIHAGCTIELRDQVMEVHTPISFARFKLGPSGIEVLPLN
ncbi:MAG: DUF342 domain-containing protein [Candidatus Hydrogenedentota bacterium]|nr:MAG: DUF342 domain-containing protein [Candidatus Hydrogenedentota bacterium]